MDDLREIEKAFSAERLQRYLSLAKGDRARALELYVYNSHMAAAFYMPIQTLEVVLRNRIHTVLSRYFDTENWFNKTLPNTSATEKQSGMIDSYRSKVIEARQEAKKDLKDKGRALVPGDIISQFSLGFWTMMFHSTFEPAWNKCLHKVLPQDTRVGLKQKTFSDRLNRVRRLSNRISHHEPILHPEIKVRYEELIEVIGWLSPETAAWCKTNSIMDLVYEPDVKELKGSPVKGRNYAPIASLAS